jgi:hypothetical protein
LISQAQQFGVGIKFNSSGRDPGDRLNIFRGKHPRHLTALHYLSVVCFMLYNNRIGSPGQPFRIHPAKQVNMNGKMIILLYILEKTI